MNFQISDKVVCINDTPISQFDGSSRLGYSLPGGMIKKGMIYVISGFTQSRPAGTFKGVAIVGKPVFRGSGPDLGWHPNRFRLISEIQEENKNRSKNELKNVL